jgi:hypothetical protein
MEHNRCQLKQVQVYLVEHQFFLDDILETCIFWTIVQHGKPPHCSIL